MNRQHAIEREQGVVLYTSWIERRGYLSVRDIFVFVFDRSHAKGGDGMIRGKTGQGD